MRDACRFAVVGEQRIVRHRQSDELAQKMVEGGLDLARPIRFRRCDLRDATLWERERDRWTRRTRQASQDQAGFDHVAATSSRPREVQDFVERQT